ncbi:hypothetical protein A3715_34025 [Oleiphilus sp. HI0009]|nr:hypothetical protein A3715_11445 [Oleiphilus sp. HI0009]KZX82442.1 hypothetical protein A3715_34025 [Oleiphilus sp. HI0009]
MTLAEEQHVSWLKHNAFNMALAIQSGNHNELVKALEYTFWEDEKSITVNVKNLEFLMRNPKKISEKEISLEVRTRQLNNL